MRSERLKEIFFSLIKKKSFLIILALLVIYKSVFNPFTGQRLIPFAFSKISTGKFVGDVKRFSLFYGIEIQNFEILSGEDFEFSPVIKIERLALLYNIPAIFTGYLRVQEIALVKPKLFLKEKSGVWNIVSLFPPGKKKEKPEEKDSKPLSEEINLHVPVKALLNMYIDSLEVDIKGEKLEANLKEFNLKIFLETFRFSKLPLGPGLVEIVKTLEISAGKEDGLPFSFSDKERKVIGKPDFYFQIKLDRGEAVPIFQSALKLKTQGLDIIIKDKKIPDPDLNLSLLCNYSPEKDELNLEHFILELSKSKWISLKGNGRDIIKKERSFQLEMLESKIDLDSLYRVIEPLGVLGGAKLGGRISIFPLKASGSISDLNLDTSPSMKDVYYSKNGVIHSVPRLGFHLNSSFNFTHEKKSDPLYFLNSYQLEKLSLEYNNILLDAESNYKKNETIDLTLIIKNIYLARFSKEVAGRASAELKAKGKDFQNLGIKLSAYIADLGFTLSGEKSQTSNLNLSADTSAHLAEGFQFQGIKNLILDLIIKNSKNERAISALARLDFSMKEKEGFLDLKRFSLKPDLIILPTILTTSLKNTVLPLKDILGREPELETKLNLKNSPSGIETSGEILAKLPGLSLNDLVSNFKVSIINGEIQKTNIEEFNFSGFQKRLSADIKGTIAKEKGNTKMDIGGAISISSKEIFSIYKNIEFSGNFRTEFKLKDDIAAGNIKAKDVNLNFIQGDCKLGDCKTWKVFGFNLDFPFEHNLKAITKNVVEGDKGKFTKTYGLAKQSNLSLREVLGPHPTIPGREQRFLGTANSPGLFARLDYNENILIMDDLWVSVLDGTIHGKDIIFNVGSGKPSEMEYAGAILVKEVDMKNLLAEKSRKSIDDGRLSLDINFSGKDLSDPVANLNLFFSIFKIGSDFGKSAVKVIKPETDSYIVESVVNGYSQIDKIQVELSKGLVYADIIFQRTFFSTVLAGLENNRLTQERMPLANFLGRAKSEISSYQ